MALDIKNMSEEDIAKVFDKMLDEFPVNNVCIRLPKWMQVLPFEHPLIQEVYNEISNTIDNFSRLGDFNIDFKMFQDSVNFDPITTKTISAGNGQIMFGINAKPHLFYDILSEQCGYEIKNEYA